MSKFRQNHLKLSDEQLAENKANTHVKRDSECTNGHSWILNNTKVIERAFGEKDSIVDYYVCSNCPACKKQVR